MRLRWPFKRRVRVVKAPFVCTHKDFTEPDKQDRLCAKYGCPGDPNWRGDGCR